jgi:hypothetical protein
VLDNPLAVHGAALAVGSAMVVAATPPRADAITAPTTRRRVTDAELFMRKVLHVGADDGLWTK